jgi:phosphohistidine phosphatase
VKHLTILRHAKAVPANAAQPDFERPLAEKGPKQIRRVVPALHTIKTPVDRILVSPSLRTMETAAHFIETLALAQESITEKRIYEATPTTLLEILRDQPGTIQHVVLIGHNPGLAMLVSGLCSGDDARLNLHLPTAGLAHIELEVARWRQVRWGSGILRLLLAPKFLKKY